jgi:hypothetical protein
MTTQPDAVDKEAMVRAIEITLASTQPGRREQVQRKLAREPWIDVAIFCAYAAQNAALDLKPWQPPPCQVRDLVARIQAGDDGIFGRFAAAKLLQRLLDAGLSRYEPDPLAALERARLRSGLSPESHKPPERPRPPAA